MNFMIDSGEIGLLGVFLMVFFLSFLGIILAKSMKLPGVVGILLVGVILRFGVDSLGFSIESVPLVDELAKFGVAFLLFLLGIEFSLGGWGRWRWKLVLLAASQIVVTVLFGYLAVSLMGIGGVSALVLALGLSLSSTAVVVKILIDKDQIQTMSGQILVLWLLVQDIAVVPMFLFFSFYQAVGSEGVWINWAGWFGVFGLVLIVWFLVKPVFDFLVKKWGREALVLVAAILGLGFGMVFEYFGLSLALGAFIAGVLVSRVNEKHEVLTRLSVLRDLFAGVFFLTLGFLVSVAVLIEEWRLIIGLVFVFGLLKMLISGVGLGLLKVHRRVAVVVAIGLFDAGEFALLLAQEGYRMGVVEMRYLSILTGVLVISMVMLPVLSLFEESLSSLLAKLGWGSEVKVWGGEGEGKVRLSGRVVIFGGGRAGRLVIDKLRRSRRKMVVVDYDLRVIERLIEKGVTAVYGDALDKETVDLLNVEESKGVVITIPDVRVVRQLVKMIRQKNSDVNLVVRAHRRSEAKEYKSLGANRVILAEESVGRLMCNYLKSRG